MAKQDERYEETVRLFGPALERLAYGYEADPDWRQDLLQGTHVALWRSFAAFDNRCSLRTWVYRVAQNRATSYVRLEPGELVQSLSLGAGNTGRAHDLETDRRIDEFRPGRDGAAMSQRARL
jgi:RNA polymerase sigma-70 factor (ECF subfamily)